MKREVLGAARRSSLVSTYGVGSILPVKDDSVMVCGLDEWPRVWESDLIDEPRLAANLGVEKLRSPATGRKDGDVPVVRFPEWGFCTHCRRLGPTWDLTRQGSRRCRVCREGTIAPSRFVICCRRGHIDDFPYRAWAHEGRDSSDCARAPMWLRSRGKSSALGDLFVKCECGARRSLQNVFQGGSLRGIRSCHGRMPWLPGAPPAECSEGVRTLQRGSSNVWFAMTRSAISIPQVESPAVRFVREKFDPDDLEDDAPSAEVVKYLKPPPGATRQEMAAALDELRGRRARNSLAPTEADLRAEEYRALCAGMNDESTSALFLCEEVDLVGSDIREEVAQVSRVGRLREVSALHGFTRIVPGSGEDAESEVPVVALSQHPTRWLPATEVLGEGIFIRLDNAAIESWEEQELARTRTDLLDRARSWIAPGSLMADTRVTARSLLLHSLAHILIDELALTSGYSASSLRERIYDHEEQAGILIYTASADSAGSLGGLAAQSEALRMRSVLESALRRALWCTTDPVCIESKSSGVNGLNLAACHACLLVPETSCERFNSGLDRAVLVGIPNEHGAIVGGFFGSWLRKIL